MRNKNSIQFTTIIILLSILTVSGEFALLYFLPEDLYAAFISCGIVLVFSLLLLFTSYHFEAVFIYMLLNVVLSSILAGYRFWEIRYFYYSVQNFDLWMIVINFFIPSFICLIGNLLDTNENLLGYHHFVRNSCILFLFFYLAVFGYLQFTPHIGGHWSNEGNNFIPFYTIAGYIEDYIYKVGAFRDIFPHLLLPVLLYVPSGYLTAMLLRHTGKLIRLITALIFPILIEVLQYITSVNNINIDDVIYGFLGGILGGLFFHLINLLFLHIKGNGYLEEERSYRNNLHF